MNPALEIYYFQVVDLWKRLCDAHFELYQMTADEYAHLLANDIDALEYKIEEKKLQVNYIADLDVIRQDVILAINAAAPSEMQVKDVSSLIQLMSKYEHEKGQNHLEKFNLLLIDIIEKIQAQNKKNQLFINKSLHQLQDVRESVLGQKGYNAYNKSGKITRNVIST